MSKTVQNCVRDLSVARQALTAEHGKQPQISESLRHILEPRRQRYTDEELLLLARMTPISRLPDQCIAMEDKPVQPPIFIRGWIIDLEQYCPEARARNLEEFLMRRILPPNGAAPKGPDGITWEKTLDHLATSENYVRTVIEEDLNIRNLPVAMYVQVIWGCTPDRKKLNAQFAVGIYDNYNVDRRPSAEDEQRIRDALGLTGEPGWFAEAPLLGDFHWYYWDEDYDEGYDEDY